MNKLNSKLYLTDVPLMLRNQIKYIHWRQEVTQAADMIQNTALNVLGSRRVRQLALTLINDSCLWKPGSFP